MNLKTIMSENEKVTKKIKILQRFQQNLNDKSVEDIKDLKILVTEGKDFNNLIKKLDSEKLEEFK